MSAIWHDHGLPSFLGAAPAFSFHDIAEFVQVIPDHYTQGAYEARQQMQAWERYFGAVFYQHNAARAYALWCVKRPWWLI